MKFAQLIHLAAGGLLALGGGFLPSLEGQEVPEGYAEHPLDDGQAYRLFEPKRKQTEYRLLVILPGGDGSRDFTPWCRMLYQEAIPDDFIAVQMIAPTWSTSSVVWPTEFSPTPGMKEPIEALFEDVVDEVKKRHRIAEGEIYTLSWSSGGPAAYLIAATQRNVKGHFIAMSVFREAWLPKRLSRYRDQRFFLYHSPEDQVCSLALAEAGKARLEEERAEVTFKTYEGGHGWAPGNDHFATIRQAFTWMTEN